MNLLEAFCVEGGYGNFIGQPQPYPVSIGTLATAKNVETFGAEHVFGNRDDREGIVGTLNRRLGAIDGRDRFNDSAWTPKAPKMGSEVQEQPSLTFRHRSQSNNNYCARAIGPKSDKFRLRLVKNYRMRHRCKVDLLLRDPTSLLSFNQK